MKQWNNIKDGMPNKIGSYIVFRNGKIGFDKVMNSRNSNVYFWWLEPEGITHWMELPNAPVEKEVK